MEDLRQIPLTQGMIAVIDTNKFDLISNYKWHVAKSRENYYAATKINGKTIKMHRILMGVTDSKVIVDHINHNGLDKRVSNLRI